MQRTHTQMQVFIAGCGPAAHLLASACAREGLQVALAGPDLDQPWPNRYGVWAAEFDNLGLGDALARRWPLIDLWLGDDHHRRFDRPYASVNNDALQALLRANLTDALLLPEAVTQVQHHLDHTLITTHTGAQHRAQVFVDATGHAGRFTHRLPGQARAFQTAYGVLATFDGPPLDPEVFTMMDFRDPAPGLEPLPGGVPSFLYAMPWGPHRAFLEETVLISNPEIPPHTLRPRLLARLAHRGIRVREIHHEELCRIPMDTPLPRVPQRALAFGGAASMAHPASGYLIARSALAAPAVARALRGALQQGANGAEATLDAWGALWPQHALRAHDLYAFGAQTLARMDADTLRSFYRAFFAQPEGAWHDYLSWGASPWELGQLMWGTYSRCGGDLRRLLRKSALTNPAPVARGWLGWGRAPAMTPAPQETSTTAR
jgi:lycopene cyclase-like protein